MGVRDVVSVSVACGTSETISLSLLDKSKLESSEVAVVHLQLHRNRRPNSLWTITERVLFIFPTPFPRSFLTNKVVRIPHSLKKAGGGYQHYVHRDAFHVFHFASSCFLQHDGVGAPHLYVRRSSGRPCKLICPTFRRHLSIHQSGHRTGTPWQKRR